MTEFFEAFNPAAANMRKQRDLEKVLVVQARTGGRGPQPIDLDSGRMLLVKPGEQAPTDGPLVRPATSRDLPRVGRVAVRAWLDAAGLHHTDPRLDELRDAAGRAASGATVLALLDEGTLAGTITWASRDGLGEASVLAVDPGHQNRGFGTGLVQAAVQLSRDAGDRAITATTLDWMTPAHVVLRRLGFVRVQADPSTPTFRLDLA